MASQAVVRLPAEWEPRDGVMLTWPHEDTDWQTDLEAAERAFVSLAAAAACFARILVVARDLDHRHHIDGLLRRAGIPAAALRFGIAPCNDTWARDHGPVVVEHRGGHGRGHGHRLRLLDFRFDGWGGKSPAELDDAITATLHAQGVFGDLELVEVPLVLEGGSIDGDGRGTLLTTRSCLLDGRRNPGMDQDAMEAALARWLGARRVLWLDHGRLEGDDTDGHVDTLARFCGPGTIAYSRCPDPADPQYPELAAMEAQLRGFRRSDGSAWELVPLDLPAPVLDPAGARLPANYANFLPLNGAVLVPAYGDPADTAACAALGRAFPGSRIVPVDCSTLVRQYGSLHCATMGLPRGALP